MNVAQTVQQPLLVGFQQVVGRLHRMAQRLMALQTATRSHQQPEAMVEPITHLGGGH
jgi:hypothetical protein